MTVVRRVISWALGALLVLLIIALVGVAALTHFDERFRVSDWRVIAHAATGLGGFPTAVNAVTEGYVLPDGLTISVYAAKVRNARLMHLTSNGDLLVSQPRLARDANGDGAPDVREVLISGLDRPHGLDVHDGWLYVAESGSVGRIRYDVVTGKTVGEFSRIVQGVPAGANHWTRTVRMGPDGWMYLSIGSSCNACIETHDWRAAIVRFRPDGSQVERYAHGLRNSVGFDWAPWNSQLYATDNGRDLLGDDFPPCELNLVVAGGFYGWPHLNGTNVPDPEFAAGDSALLAGAVPPVHDFAAHNAPLGIRFLRAPANVERYGRAAIVALHGSWNRTSPDGYKLALLQWDAQGKISKRDFLTGFIHTGTVRGRPVDIAEAADGTLFVSDDYADVIYRVGPATRSSPVSVAAPGSIEPAATAKSALAGISTEEREAASKVAGALMTRHNCLVCHVSGSLLAEKWKTLADRYTIEQLSEFFLAPTPPMPMFQLSKAERRALAVHLLDTGENSVLDSGPR